MGIDCHTMGLFYKALPVLSIVLICWGCNIPAGVALG